MNNQNAYILDKLVRIVACDKHKTKWYKYVPARKILGIFPVKECIKDHMGSSSCIESFLEFHKGDYFIEDNVVYEYPEVVMYFSGEQKRVVQFDTYKEALKYKDGILSHCGKYLDHNHRVVENEI